MEKREKKGNGNFMEHVTVGNRLRKEKYVLEEIPIDPVRKRQILGKIAEAVEEKRYLYCPTAMEVFRRQIRYISGFCIGGQMACLMVLLALFWQFQVQGDEILA